MEEQPGKKGLTPEIQALIGEIDLSIKASERVLMAADIAIERTTIVNDAVSREMLGNNKRAAAARAVLSRAGYL